MEYYLEGILGGWGSAVLDFMRSQPAVVAAVLLVWLGIFAAGQIQLRRIERKSIGLVVRMAQELMAAQPGLTLPALYEQVYAEWRERVGGWALFVPHRLELWPAPVTAETVQQKLAISPKWLAEVLQQHGLMIEESVSEVHAP
jgi:hypothetical protein